MATVALLVHPHHDEARRVAAGAAEWLVSAGHQARVLHMTEPESAAEAGVTTQLGDTDLTGTDLAVSFGGDGTFLRLVSLAWSGGIPVLGVNFGRLGYLLELEPGDLLTTLQRALSGELEIEERTALTVAVKPGAAGRTTGAAGAGAGAAAVAGGISGIEGSPTGGVANGQPPAADLSGGDGGAQEVSRSWFALNEVVLEKTVFGHTVRLATAIDGEPFLVYSADGLLVATATGSTAYNLSAGGPVLSPRLHAMVMTPVAPHLSLDRSLVLHPDQVVTVRIEHDRPAALVVDGQDAGRVQPGSVITIRVTDRPVRLVSTGQRRFGALLGNPLEGDARR